MNTDQRPLPPLLHPGRQLHDFVVGDNAELLVRLQQIAAGSPSARVFIAGPAGAGKSHLLQGVVSAGAREGGAEVVYLPARGRSGVPAAIDRRTRIIAVDDVDSLIGERTSEEWLLQSCNEVAGAMLFASAVHVGELPFVLADLRSRLCASEVFRLRALAEADQRRLVRARAAAVGLDVDDDVLDFLIHRVARDAGRLAAAVDALDAASWQARRPLTIPLVRDVLARMPSR